jgi:hypothetical protein
MAYILEEEEEEEESKHKVKIIFWDSSGFETCMVMR